MIDRILCLQKLAFCRNACQLAAALLLLMLSACATTPKPAEAPVEETPSWSISRVVHTDNAMITLLDPFDLAHHEAEPIDWFMYDFAIEDDLQTGRFAAILTERPGDYKVRLTTGPLTESERAVAGAQAVLRLRVIGRRLLLSGGDAWPSVQRNHRDFAYDQRWINIPNGDYRVVITALNPSAELTDYTFQLLKVDDIASIKHAPAMPQLIFGEPAGVVGYNAVGFQYNERCNDVPGIATWAPLVSRSMPTPGTVQEFELPRAELESGKPLVLARKPEVGAYGFFVKPAGQSKQVSGGAQPVVKTLVRCAVRITDIVVNPDSFQLAIKAIPTGIDRVPHAKKLALIEGFENWMIGTNDPAMSFKTAMVRRSENDGAMVLGVLEYLKLGSKELESLLPMSNALRVDYLLDRLDGL